MGLRGILLSRTFGRALLVVGVLAAVAAWRLDAAVKTAYQTGWVANQPGSLLESSRFGCTNCWRLPSAAWIHADAFAGAFALLTLVIAAFLFHRREPRAPLPPATAGAEDMAEAKRVRVGVDRFILALGAFGIALAAAAALVRGLGAAGHGTSWVTAGTWIQIAGLVAIAVMVVASAVDSPSTTEGPYLFVWRVGRFLYRQRINVIGLALLALVIMFVGQTSGQAIDSIRTWDVFSPPRSFGVARLGFGIGSVLLLSLVVYEGAVQLTQVSMRDLSEDDQTRKSRPVPRWWWFGVGGVVFVGGILAVSFGPFGWGLIAVGALALLLGVLDLPPLKPARNPSDYSEDERRVQRKYDERVAEILAIVPLLLFAATGVAAAIDAALAGGKAHALAPLIPTALLGLLAVLMTAERLPRWFDVPSRQKNFWALIIVLFFAVVLSLANSEVLAAFLGSAACLLAIGYTFVVFRVRPPMGERQRGDCCDAYSLSVAWGVGLGAFVAFNWNPLGSGNTIGTLAAACLGFAFWIATLNWFVYATFLRPPPKALWWIGFERLPIVTLIAIAWLAAGALRTPATLHETRLVDRKAVALPKALAVPPTPKLEDAFGKWVDAQPDLNDASSGRPVPMLLVAAHGGGIRAAYWTALVLDCIVGVSADGFDLSAVLRGDDEARKATCSSNRRGSIQQRAAARRIFVASGVSGGAFGLYAYARQMIAAGWLGYGPPKESQTWVEKRLARDFASPTIGWELFHDAPAHWLGLNSHRGGSCQMHIGSMCMTQDRAAVLEQTFDKAWPEAVRFEPRLRLAWDMRSSANPKTRSVAEAIPLLVMNTTVTGGRARGVVSAVDLGSWPRPETRHRAPGRRPGSRRILRNFDAQPLAGTVEIVQAICLSRDLRLSTAALLAGRFPYVSPSGHVSGHCRRSKGSPLGGDRRSECGKVKAKVCEMRLVDGGYAENSGLFTIDALWPSIRRLVVDYNRSKRHPRKIAPVIVELDNHYQPTLQTEFPTGGTGAETVVPLATAFGAHNAMETFARALAIRLRPPGCTITISPGLHPGLTAPLGWELSEGARKDLNEGLTRAHPTALNKDKYLPVLKLRRLQQWLGGGQMPLVEPKLGLCVPGNKKRQQ
jgi:hypothetical protein